MQEFNVKHLAKILRENSTKLYILHKHNIKNKNQREEKNIS